jgi:hypothetical protein
VRLTEDPAFCLPRQTKISEGTGMNDPIQQEAQIKGLNYDKSFVSTKGAETNDGTNMFIKDPDAMVSMSVLLLACLALAILAHAVV